MHNTIARQEKKDSKLGKVFNLIVLILVLILIAVMLWAVFGVPKSEQLPKLSNVDENQKVEFDLKPVASSGKSTQREMKTSYLSETFQGEGDSQKLQENKTSHQKTSSYSKFNYSNAF